MKKRGLVVCLLVISFILLISFISAATITDDLHINIQTTNATGSVETGTYAFVFNISNSSDCSIFSNVIYTNSTSLTTDSRGIISYYLPDVTLDYDVQYWLCYYRDGSLESTSKIAKTPYAFRAQNITLTGVEIDSNLDMGGYNVSASWFKGLFNWTISAASNLWLSFTGSELSFNETHLNKTINASIDLKASDLNVNQSDWWQTSEGYLDDVSDILGSWIVNDLSWMNWTQIDNGTFAYVDEPLWTANYSAYNSSWSSTYNSTYQTAYEFTANGTFMDASTDNWVNETGDTMTGNLVMSGTNITNASYLGVGIATPATDIEVSKQGGSAIRLTDSTAGNMYLQINNTQINMMRQADSIRGFIISTENVGAWNNVNIDAGDIIFKPNQTEVLRLDIAGNVGIGSFSPNYKLEVAGDLNVSNYFFVDSSGRVGIGSASPQNALNVIGTGNFTSNLTIDEDVLHVDSTGDKVGIGTVSPRSTLEVAGVGGSDIRIANLQDNDKYLLLNQTYISMVREDASSLGLKIQTRNTVAWGSGADAGDIIFLPNQSEAMRIDQGGNVGIGTSTPQNKLNVVGDANVTGTLYVNEQNVTDTYVPYTGALRNVFLGANNFSVNTNTLFVDKESNRVGIGTVSPGSTLDVSGSGSGELRISADVDNKYLKLNNSDIFMVRPDASIFALTIGTQSIGAWSSGSINSGDIIFKPNNTEALRLDAGGNVGIGTSTPQNLLNVIGDANVTGTLYAGIIDAVNYGLVEDDIPTLSSTWDNTMDADRLTGLDFLNNKIMLDALNITNPTGLNNKLTLDWVNITNKFITAVDDVYLYMSDTTATLNETKLNATINLIDTATNTSMKNYVNSQDTAYNSSMFTYVNAQDVIFNNSMVSYVDSQDIVYNDSMKSYVDALNVSQGSWATSSFAPIDEPLWTDNFTKYNSSWTTTDAEIWGVVSNDTFVPYTGSSANVVLGAYNFSVDTSDFFVNSNTGNVGIGTTSPQNTLNIVGTGNFTGSLTINQTKFFVNALSGRVGIGTNDPTYELDVAGDIGIDEYLYHNDDNDSLNTMLRFEDDKITLYAGGSTAFEAVQGLSPSTLKFGSVWDVSFNSGSNIFFIGGSEGTEQGNIGVGTSSPDGKFHIYSGYAGPVSATADADDLVIENAGNTGLSILTNDSSNGSIIWSSASDTIGAKIVWNYNDNLMTIGTDNGGDEIQFQTGVGSNAMRIDSSGQVGIGTTDPQQELNVKGDANVTGTLYRNNKPLIDWSEATNGTLMSQTTYDTNYTTLMLQSTFNTNYSTNDLIYRSWSLNYSDYLTTKAFATNGTYYLATNPFGFYNATSNIGNWTLDKPNYYTASQIETNFTNYYTIPQIENNFTNYYTASQINSFNYYNSTNLQNVSQLANDNSYYNSTSLTMSVIQGKGFYNTTQVDAINLSMKNYVDLNYYNITEIDEQNQTMTNYVIDTNTSMKNYVNSQDTAYNTSMFIYVNAQDIIFNNSIASYVNSQDTAYNSSMFTYVNAQDVVFNNSMASFVEATYLRNDGDNGTGEYNFGGSYIDGGVTIKDGAIYAQTGYFYNITSLEITNLNINGSLIPATGFDDTFDLGSGSLRWRNLYVGTNAYVNGSIYQDGNAVLDTRYNSLSNFTNNLGIGNWSLDKPNYYTASEIETNFTNYYTIPQIENNFTSYYTASQILGFSYYNSTNLQNVSQLANDNSYYNTTSLTTNSQLLNGNNYWNNTFATFNKTYADTLYSGIEWDYNQTTPAINAVLGFDYYNTTSLTMSVIQGKGFYNTTQVDAINLSMASYVDALNVSQGSWATSSFAPIDEPLWTGNYTAYNDSWTTTDAEIWTVVANDTFAPIDEPLWTDNFTKYNDSWTTTYNSTYQAGYEYVTNDTFVPYTGAVNNVNLGNNNFSVNSTTFFVDSNTGNVGIGTTAPQNKLNVIGDGNFTGDLHSSGDIFALNSSLSDYYLKSNLFGFYNSTNFNISDYATNIKVDSLGNWTLDKLNYYTASQIESNFTNYYTIPQIENNLTTYFTKTQVLGFSYYNSTSYPNIVDGSGTYGYIPMWNGTNSINNSAIYQNGSDVGIGTTAPSQKLHVEGNINITQNLTIGGATVFTQGEDMIFRI